MPSFFSSSKGEIGRSAYAFTGIACFCQMEPGPALLRYPRRRRLPDALFLPFARNRLFNTSGADPIRNPFVFALALPFIYAGIVLTVKRLRALHWPIWVSCVSSSSPSSISCFLPPFHLPQDSGSRGREETTENRKAKGFLARPFHAPKDKSLAPPCGRAFGGPRDPAVRLLFVKSDVYGWDLRRSPVRHGPDLRRNLWPSRKTKRMESLTRRRIVPRFFLPSSPSLRPRGYPLPVHGGSHCLSHGRRGRLGRAI